jgi:pimeloyl-ACP methyl ester carboxylesterase
MGKSDKPIMRYSTSEMAKDIIEVLDHLGWTSERQLHILGVSMGGMIAQEIVRNPTSPPKTPYIH